MARPPKNYCDYFSHDRDMRNHRKIKAIRNKFNINGYAIWCMLLEYLTGSDGNVFEYTEVELELMSGDFGVSVTEIRQVIDYCIKLELLFLKDGFINSESLDERLAPVYDKRHLSKAKSSKQKRDNGKFAENNPEVNGVSGTEIPNSAISATEMPQKKLKETKVKESIRKESIRNLEGGVPVTETLFEKEAPPVDASIISQMWVVWKTNFPTYTADKEKDFRALGEIFRFMCRQIAPGHDPTDNEFQIKLLNTFQIIADVVAQESFWSNKPLSSIANNIQEFYNKIKNPVNGQQQQKSKNGINHKLDMDKIKEAHARRYGGRQ